MDKNKKRKLNDIEWGKKGTKVQRIKGTKEMKFEDLKVWVKSKDLAVEIY